MRAGAHAFSRAAHPDGTCATGAIRYGRAASGSPIFRDGISVVATDPTRDHGAAEKWIHAVAGAAEQARRSLAIAVIVTLVGMVLLVTAVVYAAYAPAEDEGQDRCATIHLRGELADTVDGTILFGVCSAKP